MTTAAVLFYLSLVGLTSMVAMRLFEMERGTQSLLSQFDVPIGRFLTRTSVFTRALLIILIERTSLFLHSLHHEIAESVHGLFLEGERRVRTWREFARERRIERTPSSSTFINDVVEYKRELKQNGGAQHF